MASLSFSSSSSLAGTKLFVTGRPVHVRRAPQVAVAGTIGPGKKWESYELNQNKNVVKRPMHVKTGDMVVVIAGEDKGKTGKVSKVNRKTGELYMEGVNVTTRHLKSVAKGEPGKIENKESPIHHSNVMHWSETQKVRSRIGYQVNTDGKKVRVLRKTGELLPN